MVSLKNLRYL
jgi:hypothetical protein